MVKVKKDLTGLRVNSLTVLSQAEDYVSPIGKKTARWLCQCDCGNKKIISQDTLKAGIIKTCGCGQLIGLQEYRNHQKELNDLQMVGKNFGKLTVIERDSSYQDDKIHYKCLCECGNFISVRRTQLLSKEITDCGCTDNRHQRFLDITNKKFGKLTALYPTKAKNKKMYWMCQCDCGTQIEICGDSLRKGNTMSCGCLKQSQGEYLIEQLLIQHNIPYIKEFQAFKYNDTGYFARFDFYVNNEYFIEFDGKQHYETNERWWNTSNLVEEYKRRDNIKNDWCKQNNIPLIRIPYYHLNDLTYNDINLETSNYII